MTVSVYALRINRSGAHSFWPVCWSVLQFVSVFVRKNFYMGHIFWLVRVRAFIYISHEYALWQDLSVGTKFKVICQVKVEYQGHSFWKMAFGVDACLYSCCLKNKKFVNILLWLPFYISNHWDVLFFIQFMVQSQMSKLKLTKIITVTPFFLVVNSSSRALRYMEENKNTDLWFDLGQGQVSFVGD